MSDVMVKVLVSAGFLAVLTIVASFSLDALGLPIDSLGKGAAVFALVYIARG